MEFAARISNSTYEAKQAKKFDTASSSGKKKTCNKLERKEGLSRHVSTIIGLVRKTHLLQLISGNVVKSTAVGEYS